MSWSELEVELIIADYFSMLTAELVGGKTGHAEEKYFIPVFKLR